MNSKGFEVYLIKKDEDEDYEEIVYFGQEFNDEPWGYGIIFEKSGEICIGNFDGWESDVGDNIIIDSDGNIEVGKWYLDAE